MIYLESKSRAWLKAPTVKLVLDARNSKRSTNSEPESRKSKAQRHTKKELLGVKNAGSGKFLISENQDYMVLLILLGSFKSLSACPVTGY